jgi:murein DD-endopeptidase MepM/ murein hydrolase activator NlpD
VVHLDERPLKLDAEGRFVFGFGRDAATDSLLVIQHKDQQIDYPLSVRQRDYQVQRIDGLPSKMVSPDQKALERIRRENRQIAQVRAGYTESDAFRAGFILPAEGPISGVYGSQRILNGEPRRPHFGLDIAAPTGTAVIAPAAGTVALAEPDLYFTGGTLMIDHGRGITSVFSHLSALTVSEGDFVAQGEKIGEIGATGRATGPHLDWRVNWFEVRLDPALLLND